MRFMLKAMVGYNTLDEEIEIIDRVAVRGLEGKGLRRLVRLSRFGKEFQGGGI